MANWQVHRVEKPDISIIDHDRSDVDRSGIIATIDPEGSYTLADALEIADAMAATNDLADALTEATQLLLLALADEPDKTPLSFALHRHLEAWQSALKRYAGDKEPPFDKPTATHLAVRMRDVLAAWDTYQDCDHDAESHSAFLVSMERAAEVVGKYWESIK
jgi:hypothetical protein